MEKKFERNSDDKKYSRWDKMLEKKTEQRKNMKDHKKTKRENNSAIIQMNSTEN